jgi:hypothetical protein
MICKANYESNLKTKTDNILITKMDLNELSSCEISDKLSEASDDVVILKNFDYRGTKKMNTNNIIS